MGDNPVGKKLMRMAGKQEFIKIAAHLNKMKEHGREVDLDDYDFVNDAVKQMIDLVWFGYLHINPPALGFCGEMRRLPTQWLTKMWIM